jgi:uncharacterized secreted protein with C-terminal beta-propeller domain
MNDFYQANSSPNEPTNPSMSKRERILLIVLFTLILGIVATFAVRVFIQHNKNKDLGIDTRPTPIAEPHDRTDASSYFSDPELMIANQRTLKKFENAEDMASFLKMSSNNVSYGRALMEKSGISIGTDVAIETTADGFGGGPGGGSPEYSETNVQVKGVDEPDIVKTDGGHIYSVSRPAYQEHLVSIVQANEDGTLDRLAEIKVEDSVRDIFIAENRLILLGSEERFHIQPLYRSFIRQGEYSFVRVYDISEKSLPQLIRDVKFEGYYQSARMIKDHIYFVANHYGYQFFAEEPLLPRIIEGGKVLEQNADAYYYDVPYENLSITTVASINVQDSSENINSQRIFMRGSESLYMSNERLYLTSTRFVDQYMVQMKAYEEFLYGRLPQTSKAAIQEIQSISNEILSLNEKNAKIRAIYERYLARLTKQEAEVVFERMDAYMLDFFTHNYDELEKTSLTSFDVRDGQIQQRATGAVRGTILNQFSMDESNGVFRIATNVSPFTPWVLSEKGRAALEEILPEDHNQVHTLDLDLKPLASLEDIAPNERIYSTRFMGDKLYMVTFEQVDPFFVIDLSDANNPRVEGELKLPGFSQYLHPYNENFIIGFGKETSLTDEGRVIEEGLKLALFDVRDVKNPKLVDQQLIGQRGSSSVASYDHKAFLFDLKRGFIAIPTTLRDVNPEGYWGDISFEGLSVFNVSEDGFTKRGEVQHDPKKFKAQQDGKRIVPDTWYRYDRSIKRSLFIDDRLYSISDQMIQSNDLDDLDYLSHFELYNPEDYSNRPGIGIPEPFDW